VPVTLVSTGAWRSLKDDYQVRSALVKRRDTAMYEQGVCTTQDPISSIPPNDMIRLAC
jgi:hypothetical protein